MKGVTAYLQSYITQRYPTLDLRIITAGSPMTGRNGRHSRILVLESSEGTFYAKVVYYGPTLHEGRDIRLTIPALGRRRR